MSTTVNQQLLDHGIQPSAQRIAVARYVLGTRDHPTAERVFREVLSGVPMISRATVYNTLNLFVEKGLIQSHVLTEGSVVFDPKVEPHHHFIDEESGTIHDVPWESIRVSDVEALRNYEIRDYQVVMRGRKRRSPRR